MPARRVTLAVVVAAVAVLAAACTGSSSPAPSVTPTRSPVAQLKASWKASPGSLWQRSPTSTSPPFWTTDTAVIVPLTAGLTSYAAGTGRQRWHLELPADICAIAAAPNDDGIAAVLLGHGHGVDDESCATAAAVDTSTGKLLWTKPLGRGSSYGFTDVAIGPKAVAVTNPCDGALSLSVQDGSTLVDKTFRGNGCFHSFASDGRVLVDGRDHIKRASLVGYDAVTGRRLWSAPLHGDAAEADANPAVDRVISSDPLVVDARIDSHRYLQRVDTAKGTVSALGRESSDSYPATFVRQVGPDVVVQYGQSHVLFDYDATTGREVHHTVLGASESVIGLRGEDAISVQAGGSAFGGGALAVLSTDPRSGARQVLATTPLSGLSAYLGSGLGFTNALAGNALVVGGTSRVAAYALPAKGVAAGSLPDPTHYAAHDIRPDTVADLCTGLRPATRRELGFLHPTEAAPANCQFVEPEADGDIVQVAISVFTSAPRGKQSATRVARGVVRGFSKPDTTNHLPAATAVSGIGDEAFEVSSDRDHLQLARIVARRANVTVYIDVSADGEHQKASGLARLERGARLAAKDMIATIDRRR